MDKQDWYITAEDMEIRRNDTLHKTRYVHLHEEETKYSVSLCDRILDLSKTVGHDSVQLGEALIVEDGYIGCNKCINAFMLTAHNKARLEKGQREQALMAELDILHSFETTKTGFIDQTVIALFASGDYAKCSEVFKLAEKLWDERDKRVNARADEIKDKAAVIYKKYNIPQQEEVQH